MIPTNICAVCNELLDYNEMKEIRKQNASPNRIPLLKHLQKKDDDKKHKNMIAGDLNAPLKSH